MNLTRFNFLSAIILILFLTQVTQSQTNSNLNNDLKISSDQSSRFFIDDAGLLLRQSNLPMDDFVIKNKYKLGPLDVISVYGSGSYEFAYKGLLVNATGDVAMPMIGLISVGGLTLEEAEEKITTAFKSKVKSTAINVTVDQPRRLNVNFSGNIFRPGQQIVNAGTRTDFVISLLFDLESQIQPVQNQPNPSFTGVNFDEIAEKNQQSFSRNYIVEQLSTIYDLRLIRITDADGNTRIADLFGYFRTGDKSLNPYLYSGDEVFISEKDPYSSRISVSGAVQLPFDESFHTDDNIDRLIDIAGGYLEDADKSKVIIHRDAEIVEIDSGDFDNTHLLAGDRLVIPFNKEAIKFSSAWLYGEVEYPGIFSIESGVTTLHDFLEKAGGLNSEALPKAAYLIKSNQSSRGVSNKIDLTLLSKSSDQYLEGFDYLELEQALDPNRFPVDLTDENVLNSVRLEDGDKLYIPKDNQKVIVIGQVNNPGHYNYSASKSGQNYLSEAGGLTLAADGDRVFIIKAGNRAWHPIEETTIESGDIIFADRVPFEDITSIRQYQIQTENLKTSRVNLVFAAISTVAAAITTIVVVTR